MRPLLLLFCALVAFATHAQETPEAPTDVEATSSDRPGMPARSLMQERDLERNLPAGQQRRLGEGDQAFLGLYLPAAKAQPLGSVLLVGDEGEHANWPRLIEPARRALSEAGWHTLSIALPDALPPLFGLDEQVAATRTQIHADEVSSRISAGLAALQEQSPPRTVILARGLGAYWTLLAAAGAEQVESLVLFQPRSPLLAEQSLEQMMVEANRPVLDILVKGREASNLPKDRRTDARRLGNELYHQLVIGDPGSMPEAQQMLVKRIEGWLARPESQRKPR